MSLASLIATGSKVWLDGVKPDEIKNNRAWGITGATSNPTIISKILESGHFDVRIGKLIEQGLTDEQIAWELDDELDDKSVEIASLSFRLFAFSSANSRAVRVLYTCIAFYDASPKRRQGAI
jgi:transaldolase